MPGLLPKYPVYIPSKGRASNGQTARLFLAEGVPFRLVVEPQEFDDYAAAFGSENLLTLPFSNLGFGSIPARNWIKRHAIDAGAKRHWTFDDNIHLFRRRYMGKRLRCQSGPAMAIVEEFTDRYENIGIAGFQYDAFVPDNQKMPPFYLNCHVYSAMLIDNAIPWEWRGRYNEDTDLCLQVLVGGMCTVAFNAFMIAKTSTMTMKGGNTDELYKFDGRLKMARSLQRVWPYVVFTRRRYGRPQHVVRDAWRKFDTALIRRKDLDWAAIEARGADEFGLRLEQLSEIASLRIRKILESTTAT